MPTCPFKRLSLSLPWFWPYQKNRVEIHDSLNGALDGYHVTICVRRWLWFVGIKFSFFTFGKVNCIALFKINGIHLIHRRNCPTLEKNWPYILYEQPRAKRKRILLNSISPFRAISFSSAAAAKPCSLERTREPLFRSPCAHCAPPPPQWFLVLGGA